MKYKKYRKGKHTYTRLGKIIEVSNNTPQSIPVKTDPTTREVYTNYFEISFDEKGFFLVFGRRLPPAPSDKILDRIVLRLSCSTAEQLMKEIEKNLQIQQKDKKNDKD